jgi:hypothetical protein
MRKLHISLAVSLLLLLAQQGAVLHEMSHIVRVGQMDARVQADTLADKTCELCLAYSQLANPASHSIHMPLFEPSACAAGANPRYPATPADSPTARSRGPPLQS